MSFSNKALRRLYLAYLTKYEGWKVSELLDFVCFILDLFHALILRPKAEGWWVGIGFETILTFPFPPTYIATEGRRVVGGHRFWNTSYLTLKKLTILYRAKIILLTFHPTSKNYLSIFLSKWQKLSYYLFIQEGKIILLSFYPRSKKLSYYLFIQQGKIILLSFYPRSKKLSYYLFIQGGKIILLSFYPRNKNYPSSFNPKGKVSAPLMKWNTEVKPCIYFSFQIIQNFIIWFHLNYLDNKPDFSQPSPNPFGIVVRRLSK